MFVNIIKHHEWDFLLGESLGFFAMYDKEWAIPAKDSTSCAKIFYSN